MRRAFDLFVVAVCGAGVLFVAGFSLAGSTPPRWALVIVLVVIVFALAAVLTVARTSPEESITRPTDP